MDVEEITKELKRWIKPWLPKEKEPVITTERLCVNLSSNDVSLIHINHTNDAIEVLRFDTLHYEDIENLPLMLAGLVEKHHLETIPVSWLLSFDDYQLFLIESPPVPEDEFASALNWRVRSLISYPIEEAVIDYFQLPAKKASPDNPMMGVVCARANPIKKIVTIFKRSQLDLTIIDIPELAMRNLTALYEQDEKSTAFIYFHEKAVTLNISRQKTLYFTRRIDLHPSTDPGKEYEQICLEIMRYFDYFQSKWRYPSPTRLFVATSRGNIAEIAKAIGDILLIPVEPYQLKSILVDNEKQKILEEKYLLTLGCAIRQDTHHATPRS